MQGLRAHAAVSQSLQQRDTFYFPDDQNSKKAVKCKTFVCQPWRISLVDRHRRRRADKLADSLMLFPRQILGTCRSLPSSVLNTAGMASSTSAYHLSSGSPLFLH